MDTKITKVTNYKAIIRILGIIILIIGIAEVIPLIYASVTGDTAASKGFGLSAAGTLFLGLIILFTVHPGRSRFGSREGYLVVASCWIIASILGAMPFIMCGYTHDLSSAFFESASGFTTTGCTTFETGLEDNKTLLLWKAISNWMGGMGILVFVISLLPALGINGQFIARAESPGPVLQKTTVRMSDSARALYLTYISFTIAEFILLMISGEMPLYDGVITTLGSISTGGILVHAVGISYYNSIYIEVVISTFCLLASVNFVLYHYIITGKFSYFLKDIELRAYAIIIISSTAICTIGLMTFNNQDFGSALRNASFQVISFASTAGYVRTPYIAWPAICQLILLILLFVGGCSSSTAGSIKVIRVLVMLKMIARGCVRRIHPRSVVAVKIGKSSIPAPVVASITAFIFTFMTILLGSSIILSLQGFDIETSVTTVLCMLSNTGATFGYGAAIGNFSFFHPLLKIYLAIVMIVGRLELFTIIILFSRTFWSRNR